MSGNKQSDVIKACRLILQWWKKNKRDFPWRHTKEPYAVLIAEMLLRKTTAVQVKDMYSCFIKRYPNPEALSKADKSHLEKLLLPLGMEHQRAELLIKMGKALVDRFSGRVPVIKEDLLELPGVGPYAANAVLSFSYNQNEPMVDTNFIRVIERVFGEKSSKARARNDIKIWEFAGSLIPDGESRELNLGIIDFAAVLCKARNPKCIKCPVKQICRYENKCIKEKSN
ncbi:MAG: hypothetical protein ACOC5T_00615 [Elusimicrobiota bacterium]